MLVCWDRFLKSDHVDPLRAALASVTDVSMYTVGGDFRGRHTRLIQTRSSDFVSREETKRPQVEASLMKIKSRVMKQNVSY